MEENMTIEQFIEKAIEYNKENNINLNIKNPTDCPVHIYASIHNKSCKAVVQGIEQCKICDAPCCPTCKSHSVEQISRVTGYISSVSGWGESKKQELKDRKRYNLY